MNIKNSQLKKYRKKFDFSYSFGIFPTMELLKWKDKHVVKVFLKKDCERFEGITDIVGICKEKNIPIEYNDRVIDRVAYKENTYAIGVFMKYSVEIDRNSNHILLDRPRNMGNLGTIIRSMVGYGFQNLVIIGESADIYDPKVVSSTAGAFFKVNFEYISSMREYVKRFPESNIYNFVLDGSINISESEFKEPLGLVFGNEMEGLGSEYEGLGTSVFIPHSGDIESLNLSVAASIGMWETYRRKNT